MYIEAGSVKRIRKRYTRLPRCVWANGKTFAPLVPFCNFFSARKCNRASLVSFMNTRQSVVAYITRGSHKNRSRLKFLATRVKEAEWKKGKSPTVRREDEAFADSSRASWCTRSACWESNRTNRVTGFREKMLLF